MQFPRLPHQAAFAADDPELVLVRRGQVDGTGRDGWAQVARVWDVQVSTRRRSVKVKGHISTEWTVCKGGYSLPGLQPSKHMYLFQVVTKRNIMK